MTAAALPESSGSAGFALRLMLTAATLLRSTTADYTAVPSAPHSLRPVSSSATATAHAVLPGRGSSLFLNNGYPEKSIITPHWVNTKFTDMSNWHQILTGIRQVDLSNRDESIKTLMARNNPFRNKSPSMERRTPYYHALDYFLPDHIKYGYIPYAETTTKTPIAKPTNYIRRSLEITANEFSDPAAAKPSQGNPEELKTNRRIFQANISQNKNNQRRIKDKWTSIQRTAEEPISRAENSEHEFRYSTTTQASPTERAQAIESSPTVPVVMASRVENWIAHPATKRRQQDKFTSIIKKFQPSPQWPDSYQVDRNKLFAEQFQPYTQTVRERQSTYGQQQSKQVPVKRIAILHIPDTGNLETPIQNIHVVSPGPKNMKSPAYFGPTFSKTLFDKPIVSKATVNSQPFLIMPHTGKRIPLSNLSNPFIEQVLSAERRQDLKPLGLMIRPIKNIFKQIDAHKRQDTLSDSIRFSELSLDTLPAGNFIIEFGPPKHDDVVQSPTTPASSPITITNRAPALPRIATSEFTPQSFILQSAAQIQAAIPPVPLSLETAEIGDNIQQFQQNNFEPSLSSLNFRSNQFNVVSPELQNIVSNINNLQAQSIVGLQIPEMSSSLQPFATVFSGISDSTPRALPLSSDTQSNIVNNNFVPTQSNNQFFVPTQSSNQFFVPADEGDSLFFQNSNFQDFPLSNGFSQSGVNLQPVDGNHFTLPQFQQQPQETGSQAPLGFGFPKQQQPLETGSQTQFGFGFPQQQSMLIIQRPTDSSISAATSSAIASAPSATAGQNTGKQTAQVSAPTRHLWPNVHIPLEPIASDSKSKDLEQNVNSSPQQAAPPPQFGATGQRRPTGFRMPNFSFLNPFRMFWPRTTGKPNDENKNKKRETLQVTSTEGTPKEEQESFNIFNWLLTPSRIDVEDNGAVTPITAGISFPSPLMGLTAQIRNKKEVSKNQPDVQNTPDYTNNYNRPIRNQNSNSHFQVTHGKSNDVPKIFFKTDDTESPIYYIVNPEVLTPKFNYVPAVQPSTLANKKQSVPFSTAPTKSYQKVQKEKSKTLMSNGNIYGSINSPKSTKITLPSNFFEQRLKHLRPEFIQENPTEQESEEESSYAIVPDPNAVEVKPQTINHQEFANRRSEDDSITPDNIEDRLRLAQFISRRMDEIEENGESEPTVEESNIFETYLEAPGKNAEKNTTIGGGNLLNRIPVTNLGDEHTVDFTQNSERKRNFDVATQVNSQFELYNKNWKDETPGSSLKTSSVDKGLMTNQRFGKSQATTDPFGPWYILQSAGHKASKAATSGNLPVALQPKVTKQYKAGVEPQSVNFTRVKWGFWQAADMDNRPIELQKIIKKPQQLQEIDMDTEDSYSAESTQNIIVIKAIPMTGNGDVIFDNYKMEVSNSLDSFQQPERITATTSVPQTFTLLDNNVNFPAPTKLPGLTSIEPTTVASFTNVPVTNYNIVTDVKYSDRNRSRSRTRNDVFIPGFHDRTKLRDRESNDKSAEEEGDVAGTTTTTVIPFRTFPRSYYSQQQRPMARLDKVRLSQSALKDLSYFTTTTSTVSPMTQVSPNNPREMHKYSPWSEPLKTASNKYKNVVKKSNAVSQNDKLSTRISTTTKPVNNYKQTRARDEPLQVEESQIMERHSINKLPKEMSLTEDNTQEHTNEPENSSTDQGKVTRKLPYRSSDRLRALMNRKTQRNKFIEDAPEIKAPTSADNLDKSSNVVFTEDFEIPAEDSAEEISSLEDALEIITTVTSKPKQGAQEKPKQLIPSRSNMRRRAQKPRLEQSSDIDDEIKEEQNENAENKAIAEENDSPLKVNNNEQPVLGSWFNRIKNRLATFRATNDKESKMATETGFASSNDPVPVPQEVGENGQKSDSITGTFVSALRRFRMRMNTMQPSKPINGEPVKSSNLAGSDPIVSSKPDSTIHEVQQPNTGRSLSGSSSVPVPTAPISGQRQFDATKQQQYTLLPRLAAMTTPPQPTDPTVNSNHLRTQPTDPTVNSNHRRNFTPQQSLGQQAATQVNTLMSTAAVANRQHFNNPRQESTAPRQFTLPQMSASRHQQTSALQRQTSAALHQQISAASPEPMSTTLPHIGLPQQIRASPQQNQAASYYFTSQPQNAPAPTQLSAAPQRQRTVASQQMSIASQQMPDTSKEMPVASQQMPVTSQQIPVTSQQMPVTSQQLPLTSQQLPQASRQHMARAYHSNSSPHIANWEPEKL